MYVVAGGAGAGVECALLHVQVENVCVATLANGRTLICD